MQNITTGWNKVQRSSMPVAGVPVIIRPNDPPLLGEDREDTYGSGERKRTVLRGGLQYCYTIVTMVEIVDGFGEHSPSHFAEVILEGIEEPPKDSRDKKRRPKMSVGKRWEFSAVDCWRYVDPEEAAKAIEKLATAPKTTPR